MKIIDFAFHDHWEVRSIFLLKNQYLLTWNMKKYILRILISVVNNQLINIKKYEC